MRLESLQVRLNPWVLMSCVRTRGMLSFSASPNDMDMQILCSHSAVKEPHLSIQSLSDFFAHEETLPFRPLCPLLEMTDLPTNFFSLPTRKEVREGYFNVAERNSWFWFCAAAKGFASRPRPELDV